MSNSEMILAVAAGLLVLAIIVLIIKFFRQILLATLALAALVVLGIGTYALVSQGQASQEAAKAAKSAATAATISSAGQTAGSLALIALTGILAATTVAALGVAGYFWLQARNAERYDDDEGRWVSGPNARWGKHQAARRISSNDEALLPLLQQLMGMQAMMMTWMQRQGTASRRPPSAPTQMVFGDETYRPQLPSPQGQGYDVLPPEWD